MRAVRSVSALEERRERNRRRWRRRRRRQIVALLVLFPLLVAAGLLGGNAVEILGTSSATARDRARASGGVAIGPAEDAARGPITYPVPIPYDAYASAIGASASGSGAPFHRSYEPESHVSPEVRREIARLEALRRQKVAELASFDGRSVVAGELHVLDGVFQPRELLPYPILRGEDRWAIERMYLELAPGASSTGGGGPNVPEPGTGLLFAVGLVVLAAHRKARDRR